VDPYWGVAKRCGKTPPGAGWRGSTQMILDTIDRMFDEDERNLCQEP